MSATNRKHDAPSLRLVKPERGDGPPRFLFLNPYSDMACTKCPKCDAKMKVRKFPLVIHIKPEQLFILNETCRYCEGCSLLIARQSEVEELMAAAFEEGDLTIIGNEYLVIGTLPRAAWRAGQAQSKVPADVIEVTQLFENQWEFEVTGGWTLDPSHDS